jgi:hypothetical protein
VTASCHRSGIDVARLNVLRDVEQAAEGATRPSPSSGSPWARFQGQPWFRAVSSGHICVRWFQGVIPSQWRRGSPARRGLEQSYWQSSTRVRAAGASSAGRCGKPSVAEVRSGGTGSKPTAWMLRARELVRRASSEASGRRSDVLRWAGAVSTSIRWPSLAEVPVSPCRRGAGGPLYRGGGERVDSSEHPMGPRVEGLCRKRSSGD